MQIKDMIEKIIQGDVILMSTNCVRKELKFLGVTCNRALSFANRQCDTANCHDRPIVAPPSKCISTIIGAANPGRFLVCSLNMVEAVPGVPCLTISYVKMSMRSPSAASLTAVSARNAGALRAPVTAEERGSCWYRPRSKTGLKRRRRKSKARIPCLSKKASEAPSQQPPSAPAAAEPAEAPKRSQIAR
jgi:hypothetical protein